MLCSILRQKQNLDEIYVDGKRDNKVRCLITEKMSSQGVGYIELDYDNQEMPEAHIAILGEYQGRGYTFETTKTLFENIFKNEQVR